MRKKYDKLQRVLKEHFIDWDRMRLKYPITVIARAYRIHPQTLRYALHQMGFRADVQLNLYPYVPPDLANNPPLEGGDEDGESP